VLDSRAIQAIADLLAVEAESLQYYAVAGGDTHQNFMVRNAHRAAFVKCNRSGLREVLRSEYDSLVELQKYQISDLYPTPLFFIEQEELVLLGMSELQIQAITSSNAITAARGMVQHHQVVSEYCGWPSNNFIGLTPQANSQTPCWKVFFAESRLEPQLRMAVANGLDDDLRKRLERLINDIALYLKDIRPRLLHGDLWTGNLAYDVRSLHIALYDPAPYFGDPEADIAMTQLFGSLPAAFYREYRRYNPAPEGEHHLHSVYNLYHALNHFNLFGLSYSRMIDDLLTKVEQNQKN